MFRRFLYLVLLFPHWAAAQSVISDRLIWDDAPTVVEWAGVRSVIHHFTAAGEGGAAGAVESTDELPHYVRTFNAGGAAALRAEVISTELEPFTPHPDQRTDDIPDELEFTAGVIRQPEGPLGKLSVPAFVRTPAGFRRLVSFSVRLLPAPAPAAGRAARWASTSALASGDWYKIAVPAGGVYRMDRAFLADALGVADLAGLDPRNLKVYGQPTGGPLPETNNGTPPDDLTELPITVVGEEDGSFDGADYLLFHARSPHRDGYDPDRDDFVHTENIYSRRNFYYLRTDGGRGRRVGPLAPAAGGPTYADYLAGYHFEQEFANVLHELGGNAHGSGQIWFGDYFGNERERNYGSLFRIPDLVADEAVRVVAVMALRSDVRSRFALVLNGQELTSNQAAAVDIGEQEQRPPVRLTALRQSVTTTGPEMNVRISYPRPAGSDDSEAWLDYIRLAARRRLTFAGAAQFDFRVPESARRAAATYQLGDAPADAVVWRVDGADVRRAAITDGRFSAPAGRVYEYVAFRPGAGLPQPEAVGRVTNQNLHAITDAQMLIVTHRDFLAQAEELAEHRRTHNGLTTFVATAEQIYNEFSSGRPDVAAIRNFARMVHERSGNLRYLLLFGDGSFDHRDIYRFGANFLPVYQETGDFTEVRSYPADDFFGIYGDAVGGQPLGPDMDVGVGRLPVKSADEAVGVVRKLRRYDSNPDVLGDWRTRMVFVGDDEDFGQHTRDVDDVARQVQTTQPDLNFDKLYFDLFPQQSLSAGERYPDITAGLDRAVFRGAVAITYLGHGGPRGWGQERVLTIPQIRNWRRPEGAIDPIQPPVFVTATCTFSNYDDGSFVSAGEEVFLTPSGGGIALMTTTRPVFANENKILTQNTVTAMLERPDGQWRSLGDVIRIAKNRTAPNDAPTLSRRAHNVRKFTLIGDPATVIAFPTHSVRTTAVNGQPLDTVRTDTARALQEISISGEVTDRNGNLLSDFNGDVFPTIYDKPQEVKTLGQDPRSPIQTFEVQRSIVFRGRATVRGGKFTFKFVVPNDINYAFGPGKVSYYARDPARFTDASGFYNGIIIGGTSPAGTDDDRGPLVDIFLDDTDFVSGDRVDDDPLLLLHLSDDLGINVTGSSIGHDLEAVLDEDSRNPIVLNDFYEADADDFRSGKVRYPLFDLEPGKHTVKVRAWDVANNSAEAEAEFIVATDRRQALRNVLNYPNPFTDNTCFQFDHTLIGQNVEAIVQIYTVSGRLVKTLRRDYDFSDGNVRQDDCLAWDGLDEYGDQLARGVYLYQVRLRGDGTNVIDGELEKLVILK